MAAKPRFSLVALCCLGFALSASAQIDGSSFASDLRAKYGPPLARETFWPRPGIEMVVDFAANGHVCRIELPPIATGGDPYIKTKQSVDDFLAELVPLTMRGKELGRLNMAMGAPSVYSIEYENLTILESFQGSRRTGVTVMFRNEECQRQPIQ